VLLGSGIDRGGVAEPPKNDREPAFGAFGDLLCRFGRTGFAFIGLPLLCCLALAGSGARNKAAPGCFSGASPAMRDYAANFTHAAPEASIASLAAFWLFRAISTTR
jgi:hypothetical protein